MNRAEKRWLFFLLGAAALFNVVTLSPLIPWQQWLLWTHPAPDARVPVAFADSTIRLPPQGVQVNTDQYVEFVATSNDVTYGLGVFRPDGPMVFQMQVLPGMENRLVWKFDRPGAYDVRSTEYSGPRHSDMVLPGAIVVTPAP